MAYQNTAPPLPADAAATNRKYGRGAARRRQLRQQMGFADIRKTPVTGGTGLAKNLGMRPKGSPLGTGRGALPTTFRPTGRPPWEGAPQGRPHIDPFRPGATKGGPAGGKPQVGNLANDVREINDNGSRVAARATGGKRQLGVSQMRRRAIRQSLGIADVRNASQAQIRRAKRKGGLL